MARIRIDISQPDGAMRTHETLDASPLRIRDQPNIVTCSQTMNPERQRPKP